MQSVLGHASVDVPGEQALNRQQVDRARLDDEDRVAHPLGDDADAVRVDARCGRRGAAVAAPAEQAAQEAAGATAAATTATEQTAEQTATTATLTAALLLLRA